jgi:hypothetical protein
MNIIDNYLKQSEYDELSNHIMVQSFSWFFCNEKVIGSDIDYNYHFIHNVVQNGHIDSPVTFEVLKPLLNKLNAKTVFRVKINLTTKTHKLIEYPLHRDINVKDEKDIEQLRKDNFKVALYYMNTNNGYTYFENDNKVKSVANRLVKFDNITYHSGTTCTNNNKRVVININYV